MALDDHPASQSATPDPLAFLKRKEAEQASKTADLLAALRATLPDLARLIYEAGGQRVLVFGSVEDGTMHAHSDIDLAVTGLPSDDYFRVLGELLAAAPVQVDLVELERAPETLRDHILATGRYIPPPDGQNR